jgi:UDP-N-acetylglucosamine--N-acetylmuramyl-(pentapeptide) pyrophosphoryl-undecaprenol N-acetylglucosamine transferase
VTTLLVASTGGHLKELHHLHGRLAGVKGPYRWVTFDTAQSRSLLAEEAVEFVPFVGGRDPFNVTRNLRHACRILQEHDVGTVVSTGSAVALPFFAVARAKRVPCHYVESAARIEGPSLTGRLMARIPGVHLYAQYRRWAGGRWGFGGSVFDSFECEVAPAADPRLRRVVVTLGTYRGYSFERLLRRLLDVIPDGVEVLWQTGDTDVSELRIDGRRAIPERELTEAMRRADVVVAHAGVGTVLAAFEVGKCPVLVPRRFSLGEHVDDHQIQIAEELARRGLTVTVDADELRFEHLLRAAGKRVGRTVQAATFETAGSAAARAPASSASNSSKS